MTSSLNSVLVVGASGRTGNNFIKALKTYGKTWTPQITAFCREPTKLDADMKTMCSLVAKRDARSQADLQSVVDESKADLVVIAIGNGDNVGKTDIRAASATALVKVLDQKKYQSVKVLVVSSIGAGDSRIIAGFGLGRMIEFHLRHILKDHSKQEATFLSSKSLKHRTMILRPTGLTEDDNTGKVITFPKNTKCPALTTKTRGLGRIRSPTGHL